MAAETTYPEHEKMVRVKEQAEAIGDFLSFYVRDGLALCEKHEHDAGCYDETGHTFCGLRKGGWTPVHRPVEDILAEYLEIDLDKINAEKDAMLADLRSQNARPAEPR